MKVWTALYRSRFSHISIKRFIQILAVYANEIDNFQGHVDFCLSVCESVSFFGKKKLSLAITNFWSARHRDFIFGIHTMTPFQVKWFKPRSMNVWPWLLLLYLDILDFLIWITWTILYLYKHSRDTHVDVSLVYLRKLGLTHWLDCETTWEYFVCCDVMSVLM